MREIPVYLYVDENDPVQRKSLAMPDTEEDIVVRSLVCMASPGVVSMQALCGMKDADGKWSSGLLAGLGWQWVKKVPTNIIVE